MITVRPEPISSADDSKLRSWLAKGEMFLLVKIIESRIKEHGCNALEEASRANAAPLKLETANASLAKMHRYKTFLDVLEEIRSQQEPFVVNKIT